jgi:hypothetical protein
MKNTIITPSWHDVERPRIIHTRVASALYFNYYLRCVQDAKERPARRGDQPCLIIYTDYGLTNAMQYQKQQAKAWEMRCIGDTQLDRAVRPFHLTNYQITSVNWAYIQS